MKNTLQTINDLALNAPEELVARAERHYDREISNIAERISDDDDIKIVALAGPSASGKTTTAHMLCEKLKELDTSFHGAIYRASGSRILCKILSELHRNIKAYRKLSLTVPGRLEKSVEEHREITDAILRSDAEEADRLTSLHVERALANLLIATKTGDTEEN